MQRLKKDYRQKKHLLDTLKRLAEGTVVVEGKHDIAALKKLGISAMAYSAVESGNVSIPVGRTIYLLTDNDRGGDEKRERLKSALLAMDNRHTINDELGRKLLSMLHATSIEQIFGPAEEILEEK